MTALLGGQSEQSRQTHRAAKGKEEKKGAGPNTIVAEQMRAGFLESNAEVGRLARPL